MNEKTKAHIEKTQTRIKKLEHYRELGQQLVPLLEAREIIPGTKASLHKYLKLIIEEIDILKRNIMLHEKNPKRPPIGPARSPEAQQKLTQSQIMLYETYKSLGMSEEISIEIALNPRLAMFKKFDDLAIIHGLAID